MKQYSKKLFSVALLLSSAALSGMATVASVSPVSPFLQWRSQGRNTARKVVGTTSYEVDQYDREGMYGTFAATLEYDRSFRPQSISNALFGDSLFDTSSITNPTTTTATNSCNKSCGDSRCLLIQGLNNVNTPNARAWAAENFMLPNEFQSVVCMKPLVQNILVDFDWYMGFDRWAKGLYFRLYGPVVNNRTSLRAEETLSTRNLTAYDPGFVATTAVAPAQLFSNALQFFGGEALPGTIPGITFLPLQFAKWNGCGNKSKTGFAELRGEFGWNYLRENYRVGLNIQAAAPTGTRPKGEWLLEPQVGNGKHWELGVGLKSLWTMWRSEDEEKHFDFIVEADITHLFNAKQTRTFDLKGKPNSRYMLAERLASNVGVTPPILQNTTVQFDGTYSPVANFSTRDCKVSIGVQGDVVAMFTYTVRGFSWDLGYNFWGMSSEKISLSCDDDSSCPARVPFAENTWALKGDASVYGATAATPAVIVPLAATESLATIHGGTNVPARTTPNSSILTNPGINTPVTATTLINTTSTQLNPLNTAVTGPINTSGTPVFIKAADFDVEGAELRGISNKIFTHFNYTWTDHERWVPYVGAGVSAEFGSNSSNDGDCPKTTTTPTNTCNNSSSNKFALSQWAIWVKGGVSFH